MADWNVSLPDEAVEGEDTHVEDHNAVYDALREVRTNVDEIELEPGPKGDKGDTGSKGSKGDKGDPGEDGKDGSDGSDAENPFTSEEVDALKALIEDD